MIEFIGKFALVMVAMFAVDWCWTKYMLHASAKNALYAAHWSAAIIGLSAVSVASYVEDHRLILAALIGAWTGTYWAIQHERSA